MSNEEPVLYALRDAQRLHRQNPGTFAVPDRKTLDSLARGDFVKICVEFNREKIADVSGHETVQSAARIGAWRSFVGKHAERNIAGERFWVILHDVRDTYLTGTINNDLVYTVHHGLKDGDFIRFEKRHVMDVLRRR